MRAFLAVVLLTNALASAALAQSPAEWAKDHAIPLKTVEAGHGFDDMQALKKVVGDARIVQLGEATHGTREFFQLKHRMLEFLATEMGFNIFSIEANMPEAYRLNDYVLNGTGDPAALIKGMYFWTWNTEEVLDMVQWMRKFNESGKGPVQFTGFDMQTPAVAAETVWSFVSKNDPGYGRKLLDAIKLTKTPAQASKFTSATGRFPVQDAAGHKVRFSGWIKTEDVPSTGYAGLWWRVDRQGQPIAFKNLDGKAPSGTKDWKRFEIEVSVDADADNINFGVLLAGGGKAWFDDLEVQVDGKSYVNPSFDFAFESSTTKGFGSAVAGYAHVLDKEVFHGGAQSLRLERRAATSAEDTADPHASAEVWGHVVDYLGTFRETYLNKGASPKDIDWAIQNARVVQQCMLMRSNEVQRDQSMAANIQWIADNNPGSKIVVWAHNGHVGRQTFYRMEPMGANLQEAFGDKLITFGFSFSEGSFRAIETGKSLREFTVPPAPEATLDATLAETGIPLFALDIRSAPVWWSDELKTRSIGAVFSNETAASYITAIKPKGTFDVLLFVGKTTAARGLGQ